MPPASAAKLSALVTNRQLSTLGGAAVLGVFASEAAAVAFQSGGGGWVPSTNDVWVPSDSGPPWCRCRAVQPNARSS